MRGLKTYHPFPDEALMLAGQQRSGVESGLAAQRQPSRLDLVTLVAWFPWLLWLPGKLWFCSSLE